ncbi:Telomerase-binding protein [Oleoguttula mirabilis]|uniref:Telomerase-binding protein n=1 Tax=Oleoguttula mirabilis TaxID=1507867 RepID=A0AAV9JEN5_9PEZI|nr:Telomerase-binding protein [Oleoguttula mirabilis]
MPLAQSWLDMEKASGGRAVLKGTPDELKAMYGQLVASLLPQYPKPSENFESKDGDVDGIKYPHGGGWMLGDLDGDDLLCRAVAEYTNSAVVSIDYRLTPEYKWPIQLEDCMKVYKWAHQNASSFHGDAKRFYTIGGSAGGGLALAIANQIIQDPELKAGLKGIAAMVPATVHFDNVPEQYRAAYKSYAENATDVPILDKESMEIFYKYLGADPKDPSLFTLLAADSHKCFPPTYFTSCGFDPLRDDAVSMESALKAAGVPTKHDHYEGFPHYFWIFPSVPESQQYVGNLLAGIGWLQSQM